MPSHPRIALLSFVHSHENFRAEAFRTGEQPPAGVADGRAAVLMIEAACRAARVGARQTVEPDR